MVLPISYTKLGIQSIIDSFLDKYWKVHLRLIAHTFNASNFLPNPSRHP